MPEVSTLPVLMALLAIICRLREMSGRRVMLPSKEELPGVMAYAFGLTWQDSD